MYDQIVGYSIAVLMILWLIVACWREARTERFDQHEQNVP